MARHSLTGRRWVAACVRDTVIDVNTAVFWGVVLAGLAAMTTAVGTQLLNNDEPEGLGVLLVGAVVIGVALAYWLEDVDHGENSRDAEYVEGSRTAGHMPGAVARALPAGLQHLLSADGAEAAHGGEPRTAEVVRPGLHGAHVYRVLVTPPTAVEGRRTGAHRAVPGATEPHRAG